MFHKNGMRPLIISTGTKFYSILCCNSRSLQIRLKYTCSVISVKLHSLPGNSKKWGIDLFVAFCDYAGNKMDFTRGKFKGGPEPLEKKINEILGSKREDRLSNPFFELVQNTTLVRFSYLLRLCNFCKAPRDMRKFPQKCQKIAGC